MSIDRNEKIGVYGASASGGYSGRGIGVFTNEKIMDVGLDDLVLYLKEGQDAHRKVLEPITAVSMAIEVFDKLSKIKDDAKDMAFSFAKLVCHRQKGVA